MRRYSAPYVIPADPECSVLRNGVVDVDSRGVITWCGMASAAPSCDSSVEKIALTGILTPGLINAHAHSPMIPLRGLGSDVPLLRWLREVIWPVEAQLQGEDIHARVADNLTINQFCVWLNRLSEILRIRRVDQRYIDSQTLECVLELTHGPAEKGRS